MNRLLWLLLCSLLAAVAAGAGKLCGEWRKIGQKLCVAEAERLYCLDTIAVRAGDSCWSIRSANQLDEREFNEMNEGVDCNRLSIGQKLCIRAGTKKTDSTSNNSSSDPLDCLEAVTILPGDTCHGLSEHYGFNVTELNKMNKDMNCASLQVGSSVCVSREGCHLRYETRVGDSCHRISVAFKITVDELKKQNTDLDCDRLQVGRRLCVWRTSPTAVTNLTCSSMIHVKADDTCWSLSISHGISVDDLRMLNPRIDCDLLQIDTELCVTADQNKPCALFRDIGEGDTCEFIAAIEDLPYDYFLSLNPTLDCNRMNMSSQVCIGRGPFEASRCLDTFRVKSENETCVTLLAKLRISLPQLTLFNPRLNCSTPIPQFSMVCFSATKTEDRLAVADRLFQALRVASPVLFDAFVNYKSHPTQSNNGRVYNTLLRELLRKDVSRILEDLALNSKEMRLFMDSGLRSKSEMCEQLRGTAISKETIDCFCKSSRLNVYCHALLYQELEETDDEIIEDEKSRREKRSGCSLNVGLVGGADISTPEETAKLSGCFGGDCTATIGFVEISLIADICIPVITVSNGKVSFCFSSSECSRGGISDAKYFARLASDASLTASVEFCLVGSSFVRRVAKAIQASTGAKLKNSGVCFTLARAEYTPIAGKLDISSEIILAIFSVRGGAKLKAHDLPVPKMCDLKDLECEDYCLWKFHGTPNWKAYGYIEVRLFKIFSFFEGIKIVDQKFKAPSKAGCNPNKEISILWADERNCDDDSIVEVRCQSGDDKMDFKKVEREYNGLSFRPNIWGNTLFYITFLDKNGERLSFDVYGGKSKNKATNDLFLKANKGNFYYAVRNDGIYYGTDKDKVNTLKASWTQACRAKTADANEGNGNDDRDSRSEPTGVSSLPAAACGKRIVGYYTGWGKRDVSVEQLRKLTHVIFAFIATASDGSVSFGVVSEDDSSSDSAALARSRFYDLKSKARRANAGVRMIFAVGGWDNSQHFSAIAADEGKRRRFIDSCADFLKETGVDGVDVDWEYPVTGGAHEGVPADKENFVRLLRELRERLDNLQRESGRKTRYIISLASAAGEWSIRPGYDLKGILEHADFINVMTYDYYGAWGSKWGAYTGPPSPLYYGQPKGFSGKMNADFTMKFYACRSKKPSQLNMGVPFYGRYWENVGNAIDGEDEMWRTSNAVGGKFQGGYVAWKDIAASWDLSSARIHNKSRAPYIWNAGQRKFLGFENQESLREKAKYATEKNIGGLMIWAIDQDDTADSLLSVVAAANLCEKGSGDNVAHTCVPIDDVRWWNPENSDASRQGRCGKYAPLIDGYYPVCDPDDPGYACCGEHGFCGSGKEFCECAECSDYRKDPSLITKEPTKPTQPITWHTEDGKRGRCGKEAALINGRQATCNPDSSKPCCSNGFYCGSGKEFCECQGCVDFRQR